MRASLLLTVLLVGTGALAQAPTTDGAHAAHPKQGLIDLLLEYLAVRYPGHRTDTGHVLYCSVQRQRLFHVVGGTLIAEFAIATSKSGLGSEQDSYRTPTGLHRVAEKHGHGVSQFGILKDRIFTGELADSDSEGADKDWITSRILWLEGLEEGVNRGGAVDSYARYIYIHGTANERSVGAPSSRGCIRMRNADVIALFNAVPVGALVAILDN
ncbi:MAG: L,D-transpeptidase family protein [Flavobacteriales bacterium]